MELRQLRYLVAISEEQNINKAAKLCFVTQPALTQQIKKLEDEFNTSLLIRRGRGIVLSEAGERLTRHARNVIKKVDAIKKEFSITGNNNKNQLLLGTSKAIHKFIDTEAFSGIPDIKVKVRKMCDDQMQYELRRGLVNAAITSIVPDLENISVTPVAREKIYLIASKDHHLNSAESVDIASISGEPLALLTDELTQGAFLKTYLKNKKLDMKVMLEVETYDELISVIKHSNFISLIPGSLASKFQVSDICKIEIINEDFYRNFFLVWNKSKLESEVIEHLSNCFLGLSEAINFNKS